MLDRTIAHYQVTAKLGEGGMGEVYRARDSKLNREVALKVLPGVFAADPERMARFAREAQLLASLNHPNIAAIYGVEEDRGRHALVMELVEGDTLAERLARGPIPLSEALPVAVQIARAVEAAHEKGVVHRDLKPANVKVTPEGGVKVLDFGLAKALATGSGAGEEVGMTQSPTLTAQMTGAGVILGTAAYMSPEQAKGEEADQRSDIWSFGVILAEMLAGEKLFADRTVSETLASVLKSEPELSRLPATVPPAVRRLIDRCLRKDPKQRFHDMADVRLVLEDVLEGRAEDTPAATDRPRPAVVAALLVVGVLLGALAMLVVRRGGGPSGEGIPPRRYVLEYGDLRESRPAMAPDGQRVAFARDGRIWVRDLRRLETIAVGGTEGGVVPFWSPDGEWLGFSARGSLWKVRLDGSGRTAICKAGVEASGGGAAWLPDGRIVFTTGWSEIFQVGERGGDPTVFSALGEGEQDFHFVAPLPGGRGVVTVVHRGDVFDNLQLVHPDGNREEILKVEGQAISDPAYSPTGHILFNRWPSGHGLWALPFSLDTLKATSEPFPVAPDGTSPVVGADGTLVYVTLLPPVEVELVAVDRSGQVVATFGAPQPGIYPNPALSPDGERVVVPVSGSGGWDLWSFDLAGTAPRRLTFDDAPATGSPVWTPDGRELYFDRWRRTDDFHLFRTSAGGGGEAREVIEGAWPVAFTRDGETMVYDSRAPGFNWDLWMRGVDQEGPGEPLLTDPGWEVLPALSRDDRYLAYTHEDQVLVRAFPGMEGPWQVGPGSAPRWSPTGDRIFYLHGDDLIEVEVHAEPELRFETARRLFSIPMAPAMPGQPPTFAVRPDGESFVFARAVERPPGLVVVQSWLDAIE